MSDPADRHSARGQGQGQVYLLGLVWGARSSAQQWVLEVQLRGPGRPHIGSGAGRVCHHHALRQECQPGHHPDAQPPHGAPLDALWGRQLAWARVASHKLNKLHGICFGRGQEAGHSVHRTAMEPMDLFRQE